MNKKMICPKCQEEGIKILVVDSTQEEDNELVSTLRIDRKYNCYCLKCRNMFFVDFGKAILKQYHYPVCETLSGDVKLHTVYGSEFDESYKIVTIDGVTMIVAEDDEYPIVLNESNREEIINTPLETKKLIKNKWQKRYR